MEHPFIPLHSRSHILYNFVAEPNSICFIKRDDELSFGSSGSKCRKYASIIPYLLNNNIKLVFVIGSTHSNNVLAAAQLLTEYQIEVHALLLKPHNEVLNGNFKLTSMLLNKNNITFIEREDWLLVNELATNIANQFNKASYILNEGASVAEAQTGSASLASDMIINEQQLGLKFNHVFLDAGTGFAAINCILELQNLNHPAHIYVLSLADSIAILKEKFIASKVNLNNITILSPTNAKSFGSVNRTLKNYIINFAQKHGVLLDPIYSAKLFYEAQLYIRKYKLLGNILITHSGGALSLPNFNF